MLSDFTAAILSTGQQDLGTVISASSSSIFTYIGASVLNDHLHYKQGIFVDAKFAWIIVIPNF